ncbi:hypothetical protein NUACC26_012090 [Scytonema sp. NUACC26]
MSIHFDQRIALIFSFQGSCYNCTSSIGTMSMSKPDIYITFRVIPEEKEILKQYCEQTGRQQSDVMREFIRSLKKKLKAS